MVFQAERKRFGSSFKLTLSGFEATPSDCTAVCGDGIASFGGECDDGVNYGGYGESRVGSKLGPFCGDGPLPIVGSRVRRSWGGLVAETHCTGRTKVHELRRKLGILEWSTVYTDSFADRSLLRRARDITLVSPSGRTLRRTLRLIDPKTALRVLRPG